MRLRTGIVCLAAMALVIPVAACNDDDEGGVGPEPSLSQQETIPTSLHGTARGMGYWYAAANGGFESLTNIPYNDLACKNCHISTTNCLQCHSDSRGQERYSNQAVCTGCHSRQASEMLLPDVHRQAGLHCEDCHSSDEIHGDGKVRNSMFEEGSMTTACANCHDALPVIPAHQQHGTKLACAACHMQTAVTCVNCHFETEVNEKKKLAYTKANGWMFLGNFRGQVYPLNFQSVTYQGKAFVAIGPFYGHTISAKGRGCPECHDNANVQALARDGKMTVTSWDAQLKKLNMLKGVIPVPASFATALEMDFLTRTDNQWTFLKRGADKMQMLFATPLTAQQIEALKKAH